MKFVIRTLVQAIAVFLTAYILPGVVVVSFGTAVLVAILLAVANTVIKPLLFILTLPITILSLGLFSFVLNALMVLLVDWIVPGFSVGTLVNALLFSIILAVIRGALHLVAKE